MIIMFLLNFVTEYVGLVSVPMRGLNDFNKKEAEEEAEEKLVSVPMRGLNDFNSTVFFSFMDKALSFRPHAGFK